MSRGRSGCGAVVGFIGFLVMVALAVLLVAFVATYDSSAPAPTQSVQTTEAARTVAVTPEYHR